MEHKKKLLRGIYSRRLRFKEDSLKRLNPKFLRLRKLRWTFRKKLLNKYIHIQSALKYENQFYAEDLKYFLPDEFYFYDPYRFYFDIAYGKEKEFKQNLNFYTRPTTLYPADNNSGSEKKPKKLNEFKSKLTQLASRLVLKYKNKNALLINRIHNGEFNFKIVKNKQFSIKRKGKKDKLVVQPKIVENKTQKKVDVKKTKSLNSKAKKAEKNIKK